MTNAALAALLHRCATNLITPPGNVSEEETALRRLAAEVAARDYAPSPFNCPAPLTDASYAALLRKSAAEIQAMAETLDGKASARLRLWAMPGTEYVSIPAQQGAHFRFSSYCPGRGWREIPTVRE